MDSRLLHLRNDPWHTISACSAVTRQDVLNGAGNFYYVDKDHLGDGDLYLQLDVPDPNAPPPADHPAAEAGVGNHSQKPGGPKAETP